MKKYMMLILAIMVVLSAYSQEENSVDSKTTKKLTKEQKIEQKSADAEATAKLVDMMMEQKRFVLEADYMSNQTGARIIVNSKLNFIIIDSARITIQFASANGMGGLNHMGGITTDGTISKFEISKTGKTKTSYLIRLMASTVLGSYDIFLTVSPNANASATISGTGRGQLNYYGTIVPINKSRLYKAMSW